MNVSSKSEVVAKGNKHLDPARLGALDAVPPFMGAFNPTSISSNTFDTAGEASFLNMPELFCVNLSRRCILRISFSN